MCSSDLTSVEETVYWRWPYDASKHNDTSVAQKRVDAEFPGTGVGEDGGTTWTDADDTAVGISSAASNRDNYVLTLTIKAEQRKPETTP